MNRDDYIRTNPHFFRLIGWAAAGGTLALLLLALLLPAPLQEPANPAVVPNPVKAGWFLLWIQEMVSWSAAWIYPVLAASIWLVGLPWFGRRISAGYAVWWPQERRGSSLIFVVALAMVLLLTAVGLWLRGENWALVLPWP